VRVRVPGLRFFAGNRIEVFSGGSDPGIEIHKVGVKTMAEVPAEVFIDIFSAYPRPWTNNIAHSVVRPVDVLVTMGYGDVGPIFRGKRYGY